MRILVADDDPGFSHFVQRVAAGSDFVVDDVASEPSLTNTPGTIVILGKGFTHLDSRDRSSGSRVVLAVTKDSSADIEKALCAGADDVLMEPMNPGELLSRLHVARHRLATTPRFAKTSRDSLRDALDDRSTGKLAIRGARLAGAIHVDRGSISWVDIAGRNISLCALAARVNVEMDAETATAVVNEARTTSRHYTEVLSQWGLMTEALARESLRGFLADEVELLLSEEPAVALFVPYATFRASHLAFAAHEILQEPVAQSTIVPCVNRTLRGVPAVDAGGHALLERAAALDGVVRVTLIDRRSGRALGVGEHSPAEVSAVTQGLGRDHRALTFESHDTVCIARELDADRALIASFSLAFVSLGLARAALAACCAAWASAPAAAPYDSLRLNNRQRTSNHE